MTPPLGMWIPDAKQGMGEAPRGVSVRPGTVPATALTAAGDTWEGRWPRSAQPQLGTAGCVPGGARGEQPYSLASQLRVHCQGHKAPAVPVKFCLPLLKDKSVYNKGRERAGCQANKLGGKFFYLILCAQFPVSLQKAI